MGSKRWLVLVLLAGGIGSGLICSAGRPVVVAQQAPKARTVKELQARFSALQSTGGNCKALCLDRQRAAIAGTVSKNDSNVSWPIAQLIYTSAAAGAAGDAIDSEHLSVLPKSLRDMVAAKMMRLDEVGRVQVFVKPSAAMADATDALASLGANVERADETARIIQAWVPADALIKLSTDPGVAQVRLPDYGFVQAGSVTTEGDSLLKADDVRSGFGVDGNGVRVGVISDGVEGLATSQASGDLPSVNTATCDVGTGSPTDSGAGGEGTAMLEIVHDLAPGAELWFGYTGGGTDLDFNAAVNCLADNVDVIVDDLGFLLAGPYDGTSGVSLNTSQTLTDHTNRVRGYYNAVGNYALQHYQETFQDDGSGFHFHSFHSTGTTSDLAPFGKRSDNPVAVWANSVAVVELEWNDPFGGSCNDYNLTAWLHDSVTQVASSSNLQTCSQDPTELMVLDNTGGPDTIMDVTIDKASGIARTLDMFVIALPPGTPPLPNFLTFCSSVPNNSDAGGGVVSLGAIDAADSGTNDIEPFSSCGPTNDGRTKPDAVAVDGVAVTGNAYHAPFYGTSAAAPHAAGIAALLLDCNPSLTRDQLRNAMLNTAVDLGTAGIDNDFGHGRLDALAAANSVGCAAGATPTATASRTPTATRTTTNTPPASATPGPATDTPTNQAPADTPTNTSTAVPPTETSTSVAPPTSTPTLPVTETHTPAVVVPTDTPAFTDTPTFTETPTFTLTFTPTFTRTPTRTPTPTAGGDANCDGHVNSIDASLILQLTAAIIRALPCEDDADVNHDGHVNPLDAALILQYDAGLIHAL